MWSEATCTSPKTCSKCGINEGKALEHTYNVTDITEATCTEDGKKIYVCSLCGNTYTEDIPAKGHSWKDATCTEPKTCKLCGTTQGNALGHTDGEICTHCGKTLRTLGQSNALKSAKSYLSYSAFSYEGLINQLKYEKYTHDEAVYAANNCGANWNEQALKSAKSYLNYTSFSYKGLIGQLEYEQFTYSQAKYAADNCGANWNEQAKKTAASYLKFSSFSREALIEQLKYEGFTHEQAVYGVEANGY